MVQICTCNTVASAGGIDYRCPLHGTKPETKMYVYPSGLDGFDEWWQKRGYADDRPSDRYFAEDAWKAARGEQYYQCDRCGKWRTKAEGGTTFTVCDDCWNKKS